MNCDACGSTTSMPFHPTEAVVEDGEIQRNEHGEPILERNEDRAYCSIDCLEADSYERERISREDLLDSTFDDVLDEVARQMTEEGDAA